MNDTNKIPIALGSADTYLKLADPMYHEFNRRYKNRLAGGDEPLLHSLGELSPLISNVSFGVELLIKVLRIQESTIAPQGHDLLKLFNPLTKETKKNLRYRYLKHLETWKGSDDMPYVIFWLKNMVNKNTEPKQDIDAALKSMRRAFETWRYMYELESKTISCIYFNFVEANCIAKSLREEINEFKGNYVVETKYNDV